MDSLKEKQLYSEGGISLISEAVMSNKDGEKILMLEFESKSDRIIYTELSDLTINGIVAFSFYFNLNEFSMLFSSSTKDLSHFRRCSTVAQL